MALQLGRLDTPARPGVAFHLVRKLLAFNAADRERVEVVILSRNDPVSGLRVFRGAARRTPHRAWRIHAGAERVPVSPPVAREPVPQRIRAGRPGTLEAEFPAARVYPRTISDQHPDEVRIAFDGDAVLFSDEAERVYLDAGLTAFREHEASRADDPLPPGPLKPFLEALHGLQRDADGARMRVRTALVTARSAPAHERAIRTLMEWKISVDEAMFLGGLDKAPFLRERSSRNRPGMDVWQRDFFFDDQTRYCDTAAFVAPTGHVAGGVVNTNSDGPVAP